MTYSISRLATTIFVFALLAVTSTTDVRAQDAPAPAAQEMPDVVVHVTGLACSSCARSMHDALTELDGVTDAHVFLEGNQRVHVDLEEDAVLTEEQLRETVEGCGFVMEGAEFRRGRTE